MSMGEVTGCAHREWSFCSSPSSLLSCRHAGRTKSPAPPARAATSRLRTAMVATESPYVSTAYATSSVGLRAIAAAGRARSTSVSPVTSTRHASPRRGWGAEPRAAEARRRAVEVRQAARAAARALAPATCPSRRASTVRLPASAVAPATRRARRATRARPRSSERPAEPAPPAPASPSAADGEVTVIIADVVAPSEPVRRTSSTPPPLASRHVRARGGIVAPVPWPTKPGDARRR